MSRSSQPGEGMERMSAEQLEEYETDAELALYREYRDVVGRYRHVVETERRFYLANEVDLRVHAADGEVFYEVTMSDCWVWDVYRTNRAAAEVRVLTYRDVNIETLTPQE